MRAFLVSALILTACAKTGAAAEPQPSPCQAQMFEESRFTVCDPGKGRLELVAAGPKDAAMRRLSDLESGLGPKANSVAFAMNAGMYDDDGRPIGLAVVEGSQKHAINRRKGGGNFHLMPNGVFQVRKNGRPEVLPSDKWRPSPDIRFATQSGPMLVIDGKLHPAFEPDGMSRNIRNGVGVTSSGKALFVISDDAVSFGKFARFFRDRLNARDALFFDGSVSALWDPANGRRDLTKPLGPMVVAFKPRQDGALSRSGASAPGRGGHARS